MWSTKTVMRSLKKTKKPKSSYVYYLGLNLYFQVQIYKPLVLKLTIKVCMWKWRYHRYFIQYPVSDTIIYICNFNLNSSKEHLDLHTFTLLYEERPPIMADIRSRNCFSLLLKNVLSSNNQVSFASILSCASFKAFKS